MTALAANEGFFHDHSPHALNQKGYSIYEACHLGQPSTIQVGSTQLDLYSTGALLHASLCSIILARFFIQDLCIVGCCGHVTTNLV